MKRLILAIALACAGCQTVPAAPSEVANLTAVDEQTVLTFTNTYTAMSKMAAVAIRLGAPSGAMSPATVRRIGELDRRFYAAAVAAEHAYRSGNGTSYAEALIEFNRARDEFAAAL